MWLATPRADAGAPLAAHWFGERGSGRKMLVKLWRRALDTPPQAISAVLDPGPRLFHAALPGYRPSPLVETGIAAHLGVRCLVKHEGDRFGLPSFKVLGASWALHKALGEHAGAADSAVGAEQPTAGSELTLVCATDGNHGRAVARVAAMAGHTSQVFVPAGTADARIRAIEAEGADVRVVDGDYDAAVRAAAATAGGPGRLLIADTSWPGYEQIPAWISQGYATMFDECVEQVAGLGLSRPDVAFVPVGVGALASAAVVSLRAAWPDIRIVGVEPAGADCVTASLLHGGPVTVPGPHPSIMAGLNCGTPSHVAWPVLRDGLDACVVIDDEKVDDTASALAAAGLAVGETGAAAVTGLLEVATAEPGLLDWLLERGRTVLTLCTEGVTDPDRSVDAHPRSSGS